MSHVRTHIGISVLGIALLLFCARIPNSSAEPLVTDAAITEKKQEITAITQQISEIEQKIRAAESQKVTLESQLELLQNRIAKTLLQLSETRAQIDLIQAEIHFTERAILDLEAKMERQRELITHIIQQIQGQDNTLAIELFYGSEQFSSLLDTVQKLQQVNGDLTRAVTEAKASRDHLASLRATQDEKREQLRVFEEGLEKEQLQLTEETEAKQSVLTATQKSEKTFQTLVQNLKQEQVVIQNEIHALQTRLEQKIKPSDRIDGGLLVWPVDPGKRGVSATFHDPTYPFRNLFEHSGIDLPAPSGTPVRSAASGYVAWTRRGAQYGNYIMIIHSDGIATLYAHLSRVDVVADQFVPRGGQIGLVGSTGLSTGPHLHFEVRKEGIPTDPIPYLQ